MTITSSPAMLAVYRDVATAAQKRDIFISPAGVAEIDVLLSAEMRARGAEWLASEAGALGAGMMKRDQHSQPDTRERQRDHG